MNHVKDAISSRRINVVRDEDLLGLIGFFPVTWSPASMASPQVRSLAQSESTSCLPKSRGISRRRLEHCSQRLEKWRSEDPSSSSGDDKDGEVGKTGTSIERVERDPVKTATLQQAEEASTLR